MAIDKYALCFGINDYSGSGNDLQGCVNDANDWAYLAESRGYSPEVFVNTEVTKSLFLSKLREAVERLGYRDRLFVQYSGHGSKILDRSGDEVDGYDEVLVMHDFNFVSDDDLAPIFALRPFGTRIVFVSDSCHSGSVSRIAGDGAEGQRKYLDPALLVADPPDESVTRALSFLRSSDALLLSGCQDNEFSYDAYFDGRYNGAFTYYALKTFEHGITQRQWHDRVRTKLPSQYLPQTPQFYGSYSQSKWLSLD